MELHRVLSASLDPKKSWFAPQSLERRVSGNDPVQSRYVEASDHVTSKVHVKNSKWRMN